MIEILAGAAPQLFANELHLREQVDQKCLIEQFIKNQNPEDRGQPLFISCPCKNCTPHQLV